MIAVWVLLGWLALSLAFGAGFLIGAAMALGKQEDDWLQRWVGPES